MLGHHLFRGPARQLSLMRLSSLRLRSMKMIRRQNLMEKTGIAIRNFVHKCILDWIFFGGKYKMFFWSFYKVISDNTWRYILQRRFYVYLKGIHWNIKATRLQCYGNMCCKEGPMWFCLYMLNNKSYRTTMLRQIFSVKWYICKLGIKYRTIYCGRVTT